MVVVIVVIAALGQFKTTEVRRDIGWKRYAKDENQRIDIGPRRILVGLTRHMAILRDEVVVASHEQEVVVRCLTIADRHHGHALPFLVEIIAVAGRAVVQTEAVQLGVVIDVEEFLISRWRDGAIENSKRSDGRAGMVIDAARDVGRAGNVDQIDAAVDRARARVGEFLLLLSRASTRN